MNTPKHTPGPWGYNLGRGASPRFHVQASGGYQIASTPELVRHSQAFEENAQKEANARLLAASPDLLNALSRLVNAVEEHKLAGITVSSLAELNDAQDQARAAIARATGETK